MKLSGPGGSEVFIGPHMLLPADRVRHVGEAVAMVVAETMPQALDAAEAVEVDYEALPGVYESEDAVAGGAPAVWDEVAGQHPGGHVLRRCRGDRAAFASADHVVPMDFHIGRVTGVPMEPRSALGHYDAASGRYTLYAGSGGAVRQKRELAAVLGVAPDSVRVLSYDVGGNFGTRNRVFVEFGLVLWAARKIGRPVKYTATRSEAFLSDYQGRDLVTKVELALRNDGRFLAMRATNISNVGARCVSLSPLGKGAGLITGSYDIPAATLRACAVFTNTMPTNAYRSSGRPEVTFAIERLIDIAAAQLGFDRVELRRKNLVRPQAMPYRNAVGMTYDSGTYEANMDLAMRIADWNGFEERRREAAKRGRLLGRGLANYVESSIGAPNEQARITVRPEGRVDVVIGTQPSGQGHETSFAQVVSDLLGVPVATVKIILGDTDVVKWAAARIPAAPCAMPRRSSPRPPRADRQGQARLPPSCSDDTRPDRVQRRPLRLARDQPHLRLSRTGPGGRAARLPGDSRTASRSSPTMRCTIRCFPTAARSARSRSIRRPARRRLTRYASVDDVGRCINPLIVHGQTHGAIAQGVGQALWEQCYVEPDSGQPLSARSWTTACRAPTPCPRSRPRLSRCCRPPIRSASRPAAKAAPPPRRPSSSAPSSTRCAIRRARHHDAGNALSVSGK